MTKLLNKFAFVTSCFCCSQDFFLDFEQVVLKMQISANKQQVTPGDSSPPICLPKDESCCQLSQ